LVDGGVAFLLFQFCKLTLTRACDFMDKSLSHGDTNMPTCHRCGEEFANLHFHNGTTRNFSKRKYCVKCRPVGSSAPVRPIKKRTVFECVVCGTALGGRQNKFCSVQCKVQFHSSYPKQKDRAVIRKLRLLEIAGGACSVCGYNKNISNLHFHHLEPAKKSFQLDARAISNHGWDVVIEEFGKCILLCSNCHFELHHPSMDFEELKAKYKGVEVI
jgi:predicted nucleic acid-binding Zn ribbon protein